ncbi:unnamed protein product [Sphagnum balticum]
MTADDATFNFVNLSARQLSCSISSLELLMQQSCCLSAKQLKLQELNRTTQDQEKCNVLQAFNSTPQ